MKKIKYVLQHNGISITFLFCILLFMIASLCMKDQPNSEIENRPLQQLPSFSKMAIFEGTYQENFASYASDQFPLREQLAQMKTNVEVSLGKKEFNGIYIGSENELFQNRVVPDAKMMKEKIQAINTFASTYDKIQTSMLLVPNKNTILKEKLPSHIVDQDQSGNIAEFQKGLHNNVHFVDSIKALDAHKEEYIYYRSDHHWTSKGAYLAFVSWKNQMLPDEKLWNYDSYCVNENFYGTLANTSGYFRGKGDQVDIYVSKDEPEYIAQFTQSKKSTTSLFDETKSNSQNPYEIFLSGNQPLIDISTSVENEKHLLVIKDSYANSFVSFLLPYYSRITVVDPRYYYDDLKQLIEDNAISDALFLYNANTFFSDTSLQSMIHELT